MYLEIVIPAYNCENTLKRTLNSLVAQTNHAFTVLLVDDCSTQDILSIVDGFRDKLSIKYIRNQENIGCGMTRQKGIDETDADYIAFLDADDILLPNAVDVWMQEINLSRPDVIYSPFFFVTKDSAIIRENGFFMCHGKVYRVSFLKEYDIGESPEVICVDDSYLNWQVFDLATTVSILRELTLVQIDTASSVTHSVKFLRNILCDSFTARQLACEKIERFKEEPLKKFNAVKRQVQTMLKAEQENHKKIMETIDLTQLSDMHYDS